jgi:hypothetical protein
MMMVAGVAASVSAHNTFAGHFLVAVLVMIVMIMISMVLATMAMMVIMRNVELAGVSRGRTMRHICRLLIFVHLCLRSPEWTGVWPCYTAQ